MTQYRIITLRTFIADRYLQFKSKTTRTVREYPFFWRTRTVESECWRFIPQESTAYVLGDCLNEQSCLTRIPYRWEGRLLHCFYGPDDYFSGFISFMRKYPDIQKYFQEMVQKRSEYLAKEQRINTAAASGEIMEINGG